MNEIFYDKFKELRDNRGCLLVHISDGIAKTLVIMYPAGYHTLECIQFITRYTELSHQTAYTLIDTVWRNYLKRLEVRLNW